MLYLVGTSIFVDKNAYHMVGTLMSTTSLYHFDNTCHMPLLIIHTYHFQTWILQYFLRISARSYVDTYIKDMPYACEFFPLRGNQVIEPFRVCLDLTM